MKMNFFFLLIVISISFVLTNGDILLQPIVQNTTHTTLIEEFKANPELLVAQMSKADPETLDQILAMLEGLLVESESKEGELVRNLEVKQGALDQAQTNLLAAEQAAFEAGEAVTAAIAAKAAADAALVNADADVAAKKRLKETAQLHKDDAQVENDAELDDLDEEQRVLRQVIEILSQLKFSQEWQELAHVTEDQSTDEAFWNSICGDFGDLGLGDIVFVQMGDVKDYFKPRSPMSLCHFLLYHEYTWSNTEDGNYIVPSYYQDAAHYGGSLEDFPKSYDGRRFISFWGVNRDNYGGCCGPDDGGWHQSFSMYIKKQEWQEIAHVTGDQSTNAAFWNSICGDFGDLGLGDIVFVQMGEVKDYFKPRSPMSLCHFLLYHEYTWSNTEDGNYIVPSYFPDASHYGGSNVDFPKSYDGRGYISFWGVNRDNHGGCCHSTSSLYGNGPDTAAWHQSFSMYIKKQATRE